MTVFLTGILLFASQRFQAGSSGFSSKFSSSLILAGFAFLAPVGVGIFGYFKQKKRDQIFKSFAQQNGWNYVSGVDDDEVQFEDKNRYRLFTLGDRLHDEIFGFASRPIQNGALYLFDYYYEKGSRPYVMNINSTIFGIRSDTANLPYFSLYQESMGTFLGEFLGTPDIDFPTHPNFSSRYKLAGENEAWIRQFFTPQLLSYLEMFSNVNIDAGGQKMFIYTLDKLEPIENLHQFANDKIRMFNDICQYSYR